MADIESELDSNYYYLADKMELQCWHQIVIFGDDELQKRKKNYVLHQRKSKILDKVRCKPILVCQILVLEIQAKLCFFFITVNSVTLQAYGKSFNERKSKSKTTDHYPEVIAQRGITRRQNTRAAAEMSFHHT